MAAGASVLELQRFSAFLVAWKTDFEHRAC